MTLEKLNNFYILIGLEFSGFIWELPAFEELTIKLKSLKKISYISLKSKLKLRKY